MSGLLEILLIILALYITLKLFVIYIAPWLLRYYISHLQKKFYGQKSDNSQSRNQEGKVTIHRMKGNKDNDIPKDLGDYIDYEEISNNQKPTNE
jgi:hypothetical protein